jgi:hypothetical protein
MKIYSLIRSFDLGGLIPLSVLGSLFLLFAL